MLDRRGVVGLAIADRSEVGNPAHGAFPVRCWLTKAECGGASAGSADRAGRAVPQRRSLPECDSIGVRSKVANRPECVTRQRDCRSRSDGGVAPRSAGSGRPETGIDTIERIWQITPRRRRLGVPIVYLPRICGESESTVLSGLDGSARDAAATKGSSGPVLLSSGSDVPGSRAPTGPVARFSSAR